MDEGFKRFSIEDLDLDGTIRLWLAGRYSPAAIRQGLSIFGTERDKGRLQNTMAHRYLVKVIKSDKLGWIEILLYLSVSVINL